MVSLQEIREQVESLKAMLKDVKTIEDCRNLRHLGFSEDEIIVEIEEFNPVYLKDAMREYEDWDNTEVVSVGVQTFEKNIRAIAYDTQNGKVIFDVYDEEYNPEYNMLDDILLDELENAYNEAIQNIGEERT